MQMRLSTPNLQAWFHGIITGSLLALSPCGALAGGFEIEQSAYFQGMSFAGVAAGGPSLASISWNPAAAAFAGSGLTMESSYSLVLPKDDLTVLNPGAQPPPPGAAEVDVGRDTLVGASFAAWRLNDKTVLGLSINSPFGLGTKPDDSNWAGKYVALTSKIFSLNATPAVSYEIVPGVAIGGGVQFQYFDVMQLKAATPLGTSNINGDDFGVGFMAGINFRPALGTSIGLGFRSSIDHKVEGDAGIIGTALKAPIEANIELPEKVTLSLRQAVSPTARLLGTVEWANWSRFGVIPIVLERPFDGFLPAGSAIANLDFKWRDGWLFALGGEYDWSRNLTLRAGVAYEVSPVDAATTRLVQVPDSNHTWTSIGASYKLSPNSSIDFAYSHLFYQDDAPFDRVAASVLLPPVHMLGEADVSVDVVSIGWKMQWGGSSPPPEPLK
jgi:long-chain fatty acid transport protein